MSIAPPSDIVLDVAQAADPARRQAAVSKLAAAATAGGGVSVADFEAVLPSLTPGGASTLLPPFSPLEGAGRSQVPVNHGTTYQRFEAMMMQSFIENILPKDSAVWGDATSADMCRSLFAEKIADQLAKSGALGIAKTLERFETRKADAAAAAAGLPAPAGATGPVISSGSTTPMIGTVGPAALLKHKG